MAKSTKTPPKKGIAALLEKDTPKKKAPKKAAEKKQETQQAPEVSNLQLIDIKLILPDPHQPRKESSWKQNMELAESVKEHGLLQPIMVRPNGFGQYIVIYGHRRLWAAEQTGLTHIQCQVRERMEESAIKEIQLIENIQRAEMHPIEEAQAFLELVDNGNSPEEICAKVGKSVYYVRQRLKLNSLDHSWASAYKSGHLTHKDALQIAQLNPDSQIGLYEDEYEQKPFEIKPWHLSQYQYSLEDTSFDMSEDYEGLPKCGNCQFNTGANSLFPEDEKGAFCKNRKCYEMKEAYAFDRNLEKIKEDPAAILVSGEWTPEKEDIESWNSAGLEVYACRDFDEIEEPDIDNYDVDDEDDGIANRKEYERDLEEYRELIVAPTTVRAFRMNGSEKGEIVFGTLAKKSAPIGLPKQTGTGEGKSDIQDEIVRIKDREKRAKELDGEKVWTKIRELMGKPATLNKLISDEALTGGETDLLKQAIQKKISYDRQHWTKKVANNGNSNHITPLFRALILDAFVTSYGSHLRKGSDNFIAYNYIKEILPQEVAVIEIEQQEIAEKRQERVNKRIADLKKKEA